MRTPKLPANDQRALKRQRATDTVVRFWGHSSGRLRPLPYRAAGFSHGVDSGELHLSANSTGHGTITAREVPRG